MQFGYGTWDMGQYLFVKRGKVKGSREKPLYIKFLHPSPFTLPLNQAVLGHGALERK
jgi:hypothetical protein